MGLGDVIFFVHLLMHPEIFPSFLFMQMHLPAVAHQLIVLAKFFQRDRVMRWIEV
jgi:hypothetical protein